MSTVVVIGDGPSPEAMRWGEKIDAQDRIVRLWNHEWQRVEDYGARYDHGLITWPSDPLLASRVPDVSWFFYNGARTLEVPEIDGRPVVYLNHVPWVERALAAGAVPARDPIKLTRGFVAAAGSIEKLKPRRLILIGFDMLQAGCTTTPRYGADAISYRDIVFPGRLLEEQPPGSPREAHHDHAAERALILELAAEAGTEISWGF